VIPDDVILDYISVTSTKNKLDKNVKSNRSHENGCLLGLSSGIALMMEAARTSETLVNFYQTTPRYKPEDGHLSTHRRENLKS
jgi:hypothetical protein